MGPILLILLRFTAWTVGFLPLNTQRSLGRALGWILRCSGIRQNIIRQNLGYAFPEEENIRDLYTQSYEHLGHLTFEVLLLLGSTRGMKNYLDRYVELRGIEHWREAKKKGHGVLMLSSHVGNWEIMSAKGALAGMDIMLVTKRLQPDWFHEAVESARQRLGVLGTYEPRTMKDVLRQLKQNGTVGFVLDQYAGPPVGVRVPFFGLPVGTSTALATICKRTGAPVLPVVNYRTPTGYVVEIRPPLQWQEDTHPFRSLARNTASYVHVLEKDVRDHPDQWLWSHRRFKGDLSPLKETEWLEGRART